MSFNLAAGDHVNTLGLRGVATVFPPEVTLQTLILQSLSATIASAATTSAAGNVTTQALVYAGSTLSLGAALTCPLQLAGTLNANGQTISGSPVNIGGLGGATGTAAIQNDGPVTVSSWSESGGSQIRLNHPGDALGNLVLSGGSSLTFGDAAGQTIGVTVTGLSISADSDLVLEVNGQASGWVFRWKNPTGGTHVANLQTFIADDEIIFSSLNGGGYSLSADSQYTYFNVVPVPEPGSLALLAASAVAFRRRRKRTAAPAPAVPATGRITAPRNRRT
jgi:hypothetical protein